MNRLIAIVVSGILAAILVSGTASATWDWKNGSSIPCDKTTGKMC